MTHATNHATSLANAVASLIDSEKFRQWKRPPYVRRERAMLVGEQHYSPSELAKLWGVDPETIRNIFREEQGVLKIANNGKAKRQYVTLRIPLSIAERVHKRLSS